MASQPQLLMQPTQPNVATSVKRKCLVPSSSARMFSIIVTLLSFNPSSLIIVQIVFAYNR